MQTDKKSITILGSTGSIGTQTIETACHLGLKIDALAANSNSALLEEQLRRTGAKSCALADEKAAKDLKERIPDLDVKILAGKDAASEIAAKSPSDTLVNAIIGFSGLVPTVEAIKSGKNIAIANKETLVAAGELVMPLAREKNVSVLPIDSEHCAIHECLRGAQKSEIKKTHNNRLGRPVFRIQKRGPSKRNAGNGAQAP